MAYSYKFYMPKHKEPFISDMKINSLQYSFPKGITMLFYYCSYPLMTSIDDIFILLLSCYTMKHQHIKENQ